MKSTTKKSTHVKKSKKPLPPLEDLLDEKPTPPQVFVGVYKGNMHRGCLVYKRDKDYVWTVMCSDTGGTRVTHKWTVDSFEANMRPAPVPLDLVGKSKVYPLMRAVHVYLKEGAVYSEQAYRVLTKLSKGQDPDEEDTLDDLLDETPSTFKPNGSALTRTRRTEQQKAERRHKRAQRFASMTPAELKRFREARNAKRRMRRMNMKKGKGK